MNDYIIETHNLTKKYGSQTSVSHLNIHVKKGRIYGLLGRNGVNQLGRNFYIIMAVFPSF